MNLIDYLQNLYWREPLWLWLSLQPVVIAIIKNRTLASRLSCYAEKSLHPWLKVKVEQNQPHVVRLKNIAWLLGWLLLAVSLAGPRLPAAQQPHSVTARTNIMLILDMSRSMQSQDVQPSRLQRAIQEIDELLDLLHKQRVGLIVYSGHAHLYVPLTYDYAAMRFYLQDLPKITLPTRGSNLEEALQLADSLSGSEKNTAIVLITDGDYPDTVAIPDMTVAVSILAVGSVEGEAIPLKNGKWLHHQNKPVISRMNTGLLQQLARNTDGYYTPAYDDNSDWQNLISHFPRSELSTTSEKNSDILWQEKYHAFLLLAILLFVYALTPYRLVLLSKHKPAATAAALFFLVLLPFSDSHAGIFFTSSEQAAWQAWQRGDYKQAKTYYSHVKGYTGLLGQANSLYKIGDYQGAINYYRSAMLAAKNAQQRGMALFNMANSYFHRGQFEQAIRIYHDSKRYLHESKQVLHNIRIAEQLLQTVQYHLKQQQQDTSDGQHYGRGPRSINADDNQTVSDSNMLSFGKQQGKTTLPLPEIDGMSNETLQALLQAGLKNIQLASQQTISETATAPISPDLLQQQLTLPDNAQHQLWQRLFEIEQGFPAPVRQPHPIPGVRPW